jgi:hypothetical protein
MHYSNGYFIRGVHGVCRYYENVYCIRGAPKRNGQRQVLEKAAPSRTCHIWRPGAKMLTVFTNRTRATHNKVSKRCRRGTFWKSARKGFIKRESRRFYNTYKKQTEIGRNNRYHESKGGNPDMNGSAKSSGSVLTGGIFVWEGRFVWE